MLKNIPRLTNNFLCLGHSAGFFFFFFSQSVDACDDRDERTFCHQVHSRVFSEGNEVERLRGVFADCHRQKEKKSQRQMARRRQTCARSTFHLVPSKCRRGFRHIHAADVFFFSLSCVGEPFNVPCYRNNKPHSRPPKSNQNLFCAQPTFHLSVLLFVILFFSPNVSANRVVVTRGDRMKRCAVMGNVLKHTLLAIHCTRQNVAQPP